MRGLIAIVIAVVGGLIIMDQTWYQGMYLRTARHMVSRILASFGFV